MDATVLGSERFGAGEYQGSRTIGSDDGANPRFRSAHIGLFVVQVHHPKKVDILFHDGIFGCHPGSRKNKKPERTYFVDIFCMDHFKNQNILCFVVDF